jgi:hypothetical protein
MSIDKQRIKAVAALEALGFSYAPDRGWFPPINSGRVAFGGTLPDFTAEADAMHALLVIRADVLMGAPEASDSANELQLISDAVEAYEIKRWPRGKIPGGKG